MAAKVFFS